MMSPDINKADVEKITSEESSIAGPDNSESIAADTSADETAATPAAETTNPSVQNTVSAPEENTGPVEKTENRQPDKKMERKERITAARQAEASMPDAHSTETSTSEKSVPDTIQPVGQPPAQPDPIPVQSVEQQEQMIANDVTPAAEVTQPDSQQQPKPTKRPYIDITPFLKLMVEREASDMYFTCGAKVQIKINGVTLGIGNNILPKGAVNDILPGILNEKQLAEFEEEMELDTAFSLGNIGRFRINVFRQRGEAAGIVARNVLRA